MPPRKYTIHDLKALAQKKGGDCLSKEYLNSKQRLRWICSLGHKWEALRDNVARGKWCPVCANLEKGSYHRLDMEELRFIAAERGGKCISKEYKNSKFKYIWKCKNGHKWKATFSNIRSGKWCPECSRGYAERLCREYFEKSFLEKFPNQRPDWLKSPEGTALELDGYNEKLGIAFEHQGMHHYDLSTHFITESKVLKRRIAVDQFKCSRTEQAGVILIQVPALGYKLQEGDLGEFLFQEFKRLKLNYSVDPRTVEVNWDSVYGKDLRKDLEEIIRLRGGKLLSKSLIGRHSILEIQCSEKHKWQTKIPYIRNGRWCPVCGIEKNKLAMSDSIENMKKLAEIRGGKCLSIKYENGAKKLKWECKLGHVWCAIPSNIKKGHWCPLCGIEAKKNKLKSPISEMIAAASRNNGYCLSKEYINDRSKLVWKCAQGHTWEATAGAVKGSKNRKGTWCPVCSRSKIQGSKK